MTGIATEHKHRITHIGACQTRDILNIAFDQTQWGGKVFFAFGRMLGAFEIELGKWWPIVLTKCTGNFRIFTVAMDTVRLQHVIPTVGVPVYSESTAFTLCTTHSQFARTQLITLRAMDEKACLYSFVIYCGQTEYR